MDVVQVKVCPLEGVGFNRAERYRRRLAELRSGKYLFPINSAAYPFPFFPEWIYVVREPLVRSTANDQRLGSVYKNWSLSTVFDKRERNLTSIEDLNMRDWVR